MNSEVERERKRVFAVCGPTASGKSDLADRMADLLSEMHGVRVPTLVVDSMQVYREIPVITNQARRRPAELVGVASVSDDWTVARHRDAALAILGETEGPAVLDAGTGMYLNAILLDIRLSPKVSDEIRERASRMALNATNPRRAARAFELEMVGATPRSSIWDGEPRYDATLVYLRPGRDRLDAAISKRTDRIVEEGRAEARALLGTPMNPSVADSIGVRELMLHVSGSLSLGEARDLVFTRTRRLARRQTRWFDKLVDRCPRNGMRAVVIDEQNVDNDMHTLHGIMGV